MSDGPGDPDPDEARLVAGVLERAAHAVSAAVEDTSHGWWLRYTDTSMWWAGAVLAHGVVNAVPLGDRVTAAEHFYARHRVPARFQICPGCAPGLDRALARRGYSRTCPMSLQTVAADTLTPHRSPQHLRLQLRPSPDTAWFATWLSGNAAQHPPEAQRRMLERVSRTSCYLTATDNSQRPVAVARAVGDAGWTGVFDMTTLPHARRQGAGTALLAAIAGWAVEQRAPHLYLQVEQDNSAARRLYESAGFTQLAAYHYCVRTL